MRFLTLLAIIAWLSSGDVYARCDDEHAIWEAASDGVRHTLAIKSDDQVFGFIVRIEEWRRGKLAWRVQADISCSMGEVTCRLSVPNMLNPDDADKEEGDYSTAVVERIDENGDGSSEWVVLANLRQELHYAGGAKVEFLNGFGREYPDERIIIPNIYRFADCRDASDASKSGEPHPGQQIAGALFGIPQLCAAYKRDGALIPDIEGEQPPIDFRLGVWWMDDKRLVGLQYDCAVDQKNPAGTIDLSCQGWDQQWKESRAYSEARGVRRIGNVELRPCKG